MDIQHANRPGHESTLQQLLRALNEELSAQTASGQLASDLGSLRGMQLEAKHALSAIHASMNTLPKINRLPPEILALIPSFLTSHKDLISTTLVCRHWRNAIIASPPLWSFLDNDTMHSDLVAASMDRCRDTPLDVSFNSKFDKNILFLKRVVLYSPRIRKMCIPCLHWSHLADLLDAFDKPLPLLREIELGFCYYDEGPLPPFQRPFLAGATNLASLDLSGYGMSSGTLLHFIAPTLTHLKLSFNSRAPTVGELLEFLRASPSIEDLRIHSGDILVASDLLFPDRFEPVDLLSLRDIHFSWNTARSQYTLLRHIQYPPSCSVSLQFCSESDVAQSPQNTFPKSWEAFSLADPSCVTLRMKRDPYSTECTVIVKKPNGAPVSIPSENSVEQERGRTRPNEPGRASDRARSELIRVENMSLIWISSTRNDLERRWVLSHQTFD